MTVHLEAVMGVWQGVAMDSPKYHLGPSCPTLLQPEMALWPFQGWSASRKDILMPSSTPLDTLCRAPMFRSSDEEMKKNKKRHPLRNKINGISQNDKNCTINHYGLKCKVFILKTGKVFSQS
jgi:hypothetical protein